MRNAKNYATNSFGRAHTYDKLLRLRVRIPTRGTYGNSRKFDFKFMFFFFRNSTAFCSPKTPSRSANKYTRYILRITVNIIGIKRVHNLDDISRYYNSKQNEFPSHFTAVGSGIEIICTDEAIQRAIFSPFWMSFCQRF